MKFTINLTDDELCNIVRQHVRCQIGDKVSGDIAVSIGNPYSYRFDGATAIIDTDAPAEALADAAE